jgi:hypothetical protein
MLKIVTYYVTNGFVYLYLCIITFSTLKEKENRKKEFKVCWCIVNSMKLNISKTKVISFSRKTEVLIYDYKLCQSSMTQTDPIKNLEVFIDIIYFPNNVNIFSRCIKLLCLARILTFTVSSLEYIHTLYITLVKTKLE